MKSTFKIGCFMMLSVASIFCLNNVSYASQIQTGGENSVLIESETDMPIGDESEVSSGSETDPDTDDTNTASDSSEDDSEICDEYTVSSDSETDSQADGNVEHVLEVWYKGWSNESIEPFSKYHRGENHFCAKEELPLPAVDQVIKGKKVVMVYFSPDGYGKLARRVMFKESSFQMPNHDLTFGVVFSDFEEGK